jgi:hypothetical protein
MPFPLVAQPKPAPRVIAKKAKRRQVARMDRVEKEAVRKRDQEACRVCLRKTREVHERLFKSLGGVACLANSMCACRLCHDYLQGHAIKVFGVDCNSALTFEMSAPVAQHVFRGRAVPAWVSIL